MDIFSLSKIEVANNYYSNFTLGVQFPVLCTQIMPITKTELCCKLILKIANYTRHVSCKQIVVAELLNHGHKPILTFASISHVTIDLLIYNN